MVRLSVYLFVLCCLPVCMRGVDTTVRDQPADRWLVFNAGVSGILDTQKNPTFSLEYRFAETVAKIRPWLGLGWATDGAWFVGGGGAYTLVLGHGWGLTGGFAPGYYERHHGSDLGGHLEFYSYGEVSYALRDGNRVSLRFGHVSNGGIEEPNPGTELLTLGYQIRLP